MLHQCSIHFWFFADNKKEAIDISIRQSTCRAQSYIILLSSKLQVRLLASGTDSEKYLSVILTSRGCSDHFSRRHLSYSEKSFLATCQSCRQLLSVSQQYPTFVRVIAQIEDRMY